MNAITLFQKQFANINSIFHSIADDLTESEWRARLAPGQNMVGYTVWHIPRVQDSHVQTWIRGKPEVAHGDRWIRWQPLKQFGNGVGISLDDADRIANQVQRADVMEYTDIVYREIITWLKELTESYLDQTPNYKQHLAPYPEYQTPEFMEEAGDLFNQPIWSQLMRPCIGHIHRHLGELQIAKDIVRT